MSTKISKPEIRKYLRGKYGSNWWKNKTKQEKDELKKIATYHLTSSDEQVPLYTCYEETVLREPLNIYEDDNELICLRIELSRLKKEAYLRDEKLKLQIEIDSLKNKLGENPNLLEL